MTAKRFDQSLDYIINSGDDKVFAEPYGNDGLWLSIHAAQRVGTALTLSQARELRGALDKIIEALELPEFCVEGYVVNRNIGEFFTMKVRAKDESAAIDCVLNQTFDNVVSLRCGDVEVIFDESLHVGE